MRDHGCKCGLALNPATPLGVLDHVLEQLDMVLLMSVNPGFGGQSFIPYVLDKVRAVRERIDETERPIRLEVDGGVNADNIRAVADAGADTFVAGSAIFGAADYAGVIARMRARLADVRRTSRACEQHRRPTHPCSVGAEIGEETRG